MPIAGYSDWSWVHPSGTVGGSYTARFYSPSGTLSGSQTMTSDGDGHYHCRIPSLSAGHYKVVVEQTSGGAFQGHGFLDYSGSKRGASIHNVHIQERLLDFLGGHSFVTITGSTTTKLRCVTQTDLPGIVPSADGELDWQVCSVYDTSTNEYFIRTVIRSDRISSSTIDFYLNEPLPFTPGIGDYIFLRHDRALANTARLGTIQSGSTTGSVVTDISDTDGDYDDCLCIISDGTRVASRYCTEYDSSGTFTFLNVFPFTPLTGYTMVVLPHKQGGETNVTSIDFNTTSATNLKSQYDGSTQLQGGTFPLTQDQAVVASGALHIAPDSAVITTGTATSGSVTDVALADGTYHEIDDATNSIDLYYEFNIGADALPSNVQFTGRLESSNDFIRFYAFDWDGSSWDELTTFRGSDNTVDVKLSFPLLARHVGTGADEGKVRIRFFDDTFVLTSGVLYVDQLLLGYIVDADSRFDTLDSSLTTIDSNVDAVLVDTGTTLPATLATIDGIVDAILVDTGTTLPASLSTIDSNVDAILVDTGTTLPGTLSTIEGKIDTIDTVVDAILVDTDSTIPLTLADILVDTGTTLPATLASMDGKLDTIDGIVDDILVDTGTTIPGTLSTIDGIVDAILVDTGTTLPATLTTIDGKLDTIDGIVDSILADTATDIPLTLAAILVDTGTTLPATLGTIEGKIDTIDGIVDSILVDTGTTLPAQISGLNDLSAADVNAEVDTALTDIGLDHLVSTSVVGADVADDSIIAQLVSTAATADWDTYNNGTDSLEAIRNRGDSAWITGGGGSTSPQLMQSTTIATLASQTSFTLTAGSADDDAYNDATLVITDQTTSTQKAVVRVSDYVGSTRTVTLGEAAVFTVAVGDTVDVIAADPAVAIARKILANRAVVASDDLSVTIYEDDATTTNRSFTISSDGRDRTPN